MVINGIEIPDDTQALKLEPSPHLDRAVVGYDKDEDLLIYDSETLIECFVEQGMTDEEAWDWFNYNTLGTYAKGYPKFIFEENTWQIITICYNINVQQTEETWKYKSLIQQH